MVLRSRALLSRGAAADELYREAIERYQLRRALEDTTLV
jgi:hypothetical protein